jgi:hypothetical protein
MMGSFYTRMTTNCRPMKVLIKDLKLRDSEAPAYNLPLYLRRQASSVYLQEGRGPFKSLASHL